MDSCSQINYPADSDTSGWNILMTKNYINKIKAHLFVFSTLYAFN